MAKFVTLLGFGQADAGEAMRAAMAAVPGPALSLAAGAGIVALVQAACGPRRPRASGATATLKALHVVQRRLERACLAGPFLPADPAFAVCRLADLPRLLEDAAPAILIALQGPGTLHQWDEVMRWQAEPIVAARRAEIAADLAAGTPSAQALAEAVGAALTRERTLRADALADALSAVAVAMLPCVGGATEIAHTVLLPRGAEARLEAALAALPERVTRAAEADLRGPQPPVSFAAVRLDSTAPAELAAAWDELALPDRVDAAGLRQHWLRAAARHHPDGGAASDAPMVAANGTYRLLRGLLPAGPAQAPRSLASVRDAAARLHVRLTGLEQAA